MKIKTKFDPNVSSHRTWSFLTHLFFSVSLWGGATDQFVEILEHLSFSCHSQKPVKRGKKKSSVRCVVILLIFCICGLKIMLH